MNTGISGAHSLLVELCTLGWFGCCDVLVLISREVVVLGTSREAVSSSAHVSLQSVIASSGSLASSQGHHATVSETTVPQLPVEQRMLQEVERQHSATQLSQVIPSMPDTQRVLQVLEQQRRQSESEKATPQQKQQQQAEQVSLHPRGDAQLLQQLHKQQQLQQLQKQQQATVASATTAAAAAAETC